MGFKKKKGDDGEQKGDDGEQKGDDGEQAEEKPKKEKKEKEKKADGPHTKVFKPTSSRLCTDIAFLIIWLLAMVAMLACGGYAMGAGDLNYLLYPTDYLGQFCGLTESVVDRPYVYFPRLDADIVEALPLLATGWGILEFRPYGLCVSSCPETFSLANPEKYGGPEYPHPNGTAPDTYYNLQMTQKIHTYCLPIDETLPSEARTLCGDPPCTDTALNASLGGTLECAVIPSTPLVTTAWEVTSSLGAKLCQFSIVEETSAAFLPPDADAETGYFQQQFAAYVSTALSFFQEIWDYRYYVGMMGFGAPFAFSACWFLILFLFAGLLIGIALTMLGLCLLASCLYLYVKAGLFSVDEVLTFVEYNDTDGALDPVTEEDKQLYVIFSVLDTITLIGFVIFLIVARDKIKRCVAIVKESTKVFYAIPILAAYPLIPVLFTTLLVVYAAVVAGFIYTQDEGGWESMDSVLSGAVSDVNSTGVNDALDAFNELDTETRMYIMLGVHLTGVIWLYYFINSCAYSTYAGVAARWFFSHENGELNVRFYGGVCTMVDSAWCIISRHLGTIAFGSAILTLIQLVRIVCEVIDRKTKDLQDSNLVLKLTIKCAKCCLTCFFETAKKITQFGLIFTAIEGQNFCKSCFSTFGFLFANPTQVAINALVGMLLYLMIAISIPCACALLGMLWCEANGSTEPMWPACFIFVASLVISSGVAEVFRCVIDTIFLCAFKDMKANNGQPFHMSKALQDGFGITGGDDAPAGGDDAPAE